MEKIPADFKYTKTHEWIKGEEGIVEIGITDFAQRQLTDIVFVDLPKPGKVVRNGEVLLSVESVKSAEDVFCPVNGEVVQTNDILVNKPESINEDPYGTWLVRIKLSSKAENLLTPEKYRELIEK